MPQTYIIQCPKCDGMLLAPAQQKTRTCPYCNTRVELSKAKRLAKAATAMEASEMLRQLKTQKQTNPHKQTSKDRLSRL